MDEKVRKPQPHFSSQERAALLLIVKKYEKYIEEDGNNKKASRFNKNRAWMVIKQEFNKAIGTTGTERDVLSLRTKYIDMKKKHVQAMKHKRHSEDDQRRNILQELIDEVHREELNEGIIEVKNEPADDFFEEEMEMSMVEQYENSHTDDGDGYLEMENKRGANYTNYEKFLLMKLVDKYRGALINRGSDAVVRSEKTSTWETISREFRELCPEGTFRTAQKLRDKFSDMKKVHRKIIKYAATRDKEFYLMKKLLENNFNEEILPEPPSFALSKILNEAPVCIESLPDLQEDFKDDYGDTSEVDEMNDASESIPQVPVIPEIIVQPDVKPILSAEEQYYIDKNRREEEEHKMTMKILKLRAEKETLDIKYRTEEHEMRKDVLCREMEKND